MEARLKAVLLIILWPFVMVLLIALIALLSVVDFLDGYGMDFLKGLWDLMGTAITGKE